MKSARGPEGAYLEAPDIAGDPEQPQQCIQSLLAQVPVVLAQAADDPIKEGGVAEGLHAPNTVPFRGQE
jgi:hypothetical protein